MNEECLWQDRGQVQVSRAERSRGGKLRDAETRGTEAARQTALAGLAAGAQHRPPSQLLSQLRRAGSAAGGAGQALPKLEKNEQVQVWRQV